VGKIGNTNKLFAVMKNSFKPLLPILLIFVSTLVSFAQTDSVRIKLSSFVKNIHTFNNLYPQEKVYLHFDNTGYFLGDTIWFAAYTVTAADHRLSPLSRILYVELLTPAGKIIDKRKLKIENGRCHGEFPLPRTLHSGYYEVRAYTRYMLNFGDDVIFSRVFPCANSEDLKEIEEKKWEKIDDRSPFYDKMRPVREKQKKVNIAFYPEGGNLIAGLPTRIAFKATDEEGRSIAVFGSVVEPSGQEVCSIQTSQKGMGVFELTPSKDGHSAVVYYKNKKYTFKLPESLPEGYGMNLVNSDSSSVTVVLQRSAGAPVDSLGLSVSCRGVACMFEIFALTDNTATIAIPTGDLPEGVNRLTLFDAKGEIYADRLFFVRHNSEVYKVIITEETADGQAIETPKPLEKVKMKIQVLDENDQAVEASFSVAVREAGSSPSSPYLDNIRTNLLLCSEVKGYVENPGWYFEKEDRQRTQALDLLLLTQGWRRYSWQKAVGTEAFVPKHYIEEEILIKGRILSKIDRTPDAGMKVTIVMPITDSTAFKGSYLTKQDGEFLFSTGDFEGTRSLTLTVDSIGSDNSAEAVDRRITLDRQFTPIARDIYPEETEYLAAFLPRAVEPVADTTQSERQIERLQKLQEVSIKAKKLRPDIVYDVDAETGYYKDLGADLPYTRFTDYMIYRDKNFYMRDKKRDSPGYPVYNNNRSPVNYATFRGKWKDQNVVDVLLNEYRQGLIEEIEKIIISFDGEIAREVQKKKHWYSPVIHQVPYEITFYANQGIRRTNMAGYSVVTDFYMPDYEQTPLIPGAIDERRTLCWLPDIETGKEIEYYRNSSDKESNVSVEGFTGKGAVLCGAYY
jgi:hypothetical protein